MKPDKILRNVMKKFPPLNDYVNFYRSEETTNELKWPAWCFLPIEGWSAAIIAAARNKNYSHAQLENMNNNISELSSLGTWQFSKGVYQIDPDLLNALQDSKLEGNIPSEVLHKLPEWCIYVETHDYEYMGMTCQGFWCHLDYDMVNLRTELRLMLNSEMGLMPVAFHVGNWTVEEGVNRAVAIAAERSNGLNLLFDEEGTFAEMSAISLKPLISILLYICSEKPEITDTRAPGVKPEKLAPLKTKKGWKLPERPNPRVWSVGNQIGSRLRAANENHELPTSTGHKKKAHIRKGHWHTFWTGSRSGVQKPILNWIPPLVAGGYDQEN